MSENSLTMFDDGENEPEHTLGQYNGYVIRCRFVDGVPYLSATDMCVASGKPWGNYRRSKQAQEIIEDICGELRCSESNIIISVIGKGKEQGTWIHEDIAHDLAMWFNVKFKRWVINQIKAITQGKPVVTRELAEAKTTDVGMPLFDAAMADFRADMAEMQQQIARLTEMQIGQGKVQIEILQELVIATRRIDDRTKGKREDVSGVDKKRLVAIVGARFHGTCPCCHRAEIVKDGKRVPDISQVDHYHHRSMAAIEYVWLVCKACNRKLRNRKPGGFWLAKGPAFQAFQEIVHEDAQLKLPFCDAIN
jgi:hypothetical protein